jgi:hypothetical protein
MAGMRVILIRPQEDGSKLTLTLQEMENGIEDDSLPKDGRRGGRKEKLQVRSSRKIKPPPW